MNKAQLVQAVADRTGSSPTEARRHVDAVFEEIVSGVSDGERVSILGFGTFDSTARSARTARNPRTGATIDVPAATVPRFRIGAGFKSRVSGTATTPGAATRTTAATTTSTPKASTTTVKPAKPAKKSKKDAPKPSVKSSDAKSKSDKQGKKDKKDSKKSKKK